MVIFYTRPDGRSPVKDLLNQLSASAHTKVLRQLLYLQEFGPAVSIPSNKKLKGTPLWELRILGKDNLRVIYAQTNKNELTILHIFKKESQKTPRRELNLAISRLSGIDK